MRQVKIQPHPLYGYDCLWISITPNVFSDYRAALSDYHTSPAVNVWLYAVLDIAKLVVKHFADRTWLLTKDV